MALGVLCFLIGSICLKKEGYSVLKQYRQGTWKAAAVKKKKKHYKPFFILAILCFAATLVLSILRLLDGMTIPL